VAAAPFTVLGQYPDTEYLGGSKTRPVQVLEAATVDHGVYFEVRLPRSEASTDNLRALAGANATTYEALFDYTGVSDVQWSQEPTAAGMLADHVIIYVTSDSGDSEGVLDVRLDQLTNEYVQPRIAALRAALNATEG